MASRPQAKPLPTPADPAPGAPGREHGIHLLRLARNLLAEAEPRAVLDRALA